MRRTHEPISIKFEPGLYSSNAPALAARDLGDMAASVVFRAHLRGDTATEATGRLLQEELAAGNPAAIQATEVFVDAYRPADPIPLSDSRIPSNGNGNHQPK